MLKTACRSLSRSPVLSGGLMQSYCRRGVDELGHFGSSHASQRGILFSYGGRIERLDLLLPDCRKSCGPLSPWTIPEVPARDSAIGCFTANSAASHCPTGLT